MVKRTVVKLGVTRTTIESWRLCSLAVRAFPTMGPSASVGLDFPICRTQIINLSLQGAPYYSWSLNLSFTPDIPLDSRFLLLKQWAFNTQISKVSLLPLPPCSSPTVFLSSVEDNRSFPWLKPLSLSHLSDVAPALSALIVPTSGDSRVSGPTRTHSSFWPSAEPGTGALCRPTPGPNNKVSPPAMGRAHRAPPALAPKEQPMLPYLCK